jgi:hypothetical protein
VLHTPPEPCTLLLKSLKKEVREYTRLYEAYRLLHDEVIIRVCYQYADRYKETIKEEMEVVNRLRKPMNEANNRYDSIGYREHTPEEEKLAEREYERCKAEYEREKAQLEHLYEQQTLLWKEARQYMKNRCDDIYLLSVHFMGILTKYVPDEESQPNEADRQSRTDSQPEAETTTASTTATTAGLPEYFSMKLISLIHEVCVGEQFEDITAPDFYACMNLHPCQCVLKIKAEKVKADFDAVYKLFLTLPQEEQSQIELEAYNDFLKESESSDNKTLRGIFEKSKKPLIIKKFKEKKFKPRKKS